MAKERKTTWQGLLFLGSWVLIAIAAIVYNVSEYTVNTHLGRVQEWWAIGIFVAGLIAMLISRAAAK